MHWILLQGLIKPHKQPISKAFIGCIAVCSMSCAAILSAMLLFDGYISFVKESTLALAPQITVIRGDALQRSAQSAISDLEPLQFLANRPEVLAFQGIVKFKAPLTLIGLGKTNTQQVLVIGLGQSSSTKQTMPILDSVLPSIVNELFTRSNGCIVATGVLTTQRAGDTIMVASVSSSINCVVLGSVNTGLIKAPIVIMQAGAANYLKGESQTVLYDNVAIRLYPKHDSKTVCQALQREANSNGHGQFLFGYWKTLFSDGLSMITSFKRVLLGILSSLFIIGGTFIYATLDIVIRRKRKQMALLVALGYPTKHIRGVFIVYAAIIGTCSLASGYLAAVALTHMIQHLPIAQRLLAVSGATVIRPHTAIDMLVVTTLLALGTTLLAACLATCRISTIHPVNDLRK